MNFIFYSFVFLCFSFSLISVSASYMEQKLLQKLLLNYSSAVRPVAEPNTIINITFNMKIWQVIHIEEKYQRITIHNYFQMNWKNEMLKWDPKEWGNITYLIVRPENVWLPDIVLLNSADANGYSIQKDTDTVKLDYNGDNEWYPKVMLTASFTADTKYFPYDVQHFSFRFESWSFPYDKLRILKNNQPMIDQHFVNSSEWELTRMDKYSSVQDYNDDLFSDIVFTFTFARKPSYFVMTLIMPCIILISTVLFSYFLPASSGERMGVVVTVLLGFAVFLEVVASSLPQNANSTQLLSVYILATMFQCALSFFVTCIVITLLHNNTDESHPPPNWIRKYVLRTVEKSHVTDNNSTWFQYAFHDDDSSPAANNSPKRFCDSVKLKKQANSANSLSVQYLNNISDELKRITTYINEHENQEEIRCEWLKLANIVDRMSFWFFLFLAILSYGVLTLGYKRCY